MKIAIVGDIHLTDIKPRNRKDDFNQALYDKLAYVFKTNEVILCLGDLFDKGKVSENIIYETLTFLLEKEKEGKQFYTLVGNHDLYKYNLDYTKDSSIGLIDLIYYHVLNRRLILEGSLVIDNQKITAIPFLLEKPDLSIYQDSNEILLGHYYYDQKFEKDLSYHYEDLVDTKAKALFLGHDHKTYPEILIEGTRLLRCGALCRRTHPEAKRTVYYYQLETTTGAISLEHIPTNRDAFVEQAKVVVIDKPTLKKPEAKNQIKLSEALKVLDAKESVVNKIREKYQQIGIQFK